MKSLEYLVLVTALASAAFAQEPKNTPANPKPPADPGAAAAPRTQADRSTTTDARTWTGTIVNATCSQAADLPSASSSQSTSSTDQKTTKAAKNKELSVYDLEREVTKHCPADNNTTAFAVLTDDGSFYKLDDTGNSQVKAQSSSSEKSKTKIKNMRVTVTGTVQGDSLKVQSLTKTDKPFGG